MASYILSQEILPSEIGNLTNLEILALSYNNLQGIVFLKHNRDDANYATNRDLTNLDAPTRISYYDLLQGTNGFDEGNLLGSGSFGSVYKAILPNEKIVAVKVFNIDIEEALRSFDIECAAMCNLRHRNLIKIISSCSNDDFKSLVMEFMSNGSLDRWLYSHNYCLDILQRLNIMVDVAAALEYLHHGTLTRIVHCDIKPSNVLLDENMVAHLSDFGIAKLLSEEQLETHTKTLATVGYMAPEYGSKGVVSFKGDVYSYGIVLMEMFTRKKPTDEMFVEGLGLKDWFPAHPQEPTFTSHGTGSLTILPHPHSSLCSTPTMPATTTTTSMMADSSDLDEHDDGQRRLR
ncbi:probable LRR receptor-like serine/threonine-protein kinase At3g47570 [Neltuma alba]|uniref:probable LRR receptor-like serine/threonine-protein kinase At3g47570 n=1 Tax=Neltuma alba TaxID=207710 RepID=UPI0010A53FAD|nr:probable LRR receptor-like serine/threonine-protein kinase At3g47570 [Prosopis alba]